MTSVRLQNIAKTFTASNTRKNITVLSDISLEIRESEFFTFVGPSGSGKSTLLNIIAGLDTASHGEVFFDDRPVSMLSARKRDVAMVFQSYALYPHLSVFENIAFPLRIRKQSADSIKTAVAAIAETLGLTPLLARRPKELSGGQKQRVALARALVRRPQLFLMDEPLSNLDPGLRLEMRTELKRIHREFGTTTVYVTHDQEEAMILSDRMAILADGRLQQTGTPREVYLTPTNRFVAGFVGMPPMSFLPASIFALPDAIDLIPAGHNPEKLLCGYRPADMTLATQSPDGREGDAELIRLHARVLGMEQTGSDTWLALDFEESCRQPPRGFADNSHGQARIRSETEIQISSEVQLVIKRQKLAFFERESGTRVSQETL